VRKKFLQLAAACLAVEEKWSDNGYEEPGISYCFIKPLLKLLAEFDAVDVLENIEFTLARYDFNTELQ